MSANEKLTWINAMLQSPFPSPEDAIPTRADLGVWHAMVSRVESRLMFLSALAPSILKQGRVPPVSSEDETPLTLQDLAKMVDVLDDVSFSAASNPGALSAPIHQGLASLLSFKSYITSDPVLRSITMTAAKSVKEKTVGTFPKLSAISSDDNVRRSLYRAYAFYSVNMGVVEFSEGVIQSVRFNPAWAEKDESVIYSLLAYIIKTQKLESLPGVEKIATKGYESSPQFKTVLGLIKAIG